MFQGKKKTATGVRYEVLLEEFNLPSSPRSGASSQYSADSRDGSPRKGQQHSSKKPAKLDLFPELHLEEPAQNAAMKPSKVRHDVTRPFPPRPMSTASSRRPPDMVGTSRWRPQESEQWGPRGSGSHHGGSHDRIPVHEPPPVGTGYESPAMGSPVHGGGAPVMGYPVEGYPVERPKGGEVAQGIPVPNSKHGKKGQEQGPDTATPPSSPPKDQGKEKGKLERAKSW